MVYLQSGYSRPLPTIIFGVVGLVAGLSAIVLPETKGQKLPETLEEGENFGKRNKRFVTVFHDGYSYIYIPYSLD